MRALRTFSAFLIAVLVLAEAPAGAGASPPPSSDDTTANLISCLAEHRTMAAVVLVDESKSLVTTDPDGTRVVLGTSIIDALAALTDISVEGTATRVDVLVAGFGSQVQAADSSVPAPDDWVTLSPSTSDVARAQIASFKTRMSSNNTDYVDALFQAQALLTQRAPEVDPSTPENVCTAVFWFTDGRLDISPSSERRWWAQDQQLNNDAATTAVEALGSDLLCGVGGISDQLRRSNTYLLTFALLSPGFSGGPEQLLRGITLGDGGCGAESAVGKGQYFAEASIGDLVSCFLTTIVNGRCNEPPKVGCSVAAPCREVITADDAIGSFALSVAAAPSLDGATLISPSGVRIPLAESGDAITAGGATVIVHAYSTSAIVSANLDDSGAGNGAWVVEHAPPVIGSLLVVSDLKGVYSLQLDSPSSVNRGEVFDATVLLVGRHGEPVGYGGLEGAPTVRATLMDGSDRIDLVVSSTSTAGQFAVTVPVQNRGSAPTVRLVVEGTASSSAGDAVDLSPVSATIAVVLPGMAIPPEVVRLGVVEASRASDRNGEGIQPVLPIEQPVPGVIFTGAENGPSTVCLASSGVEVAGDSTAEMEATGGCIEVMPGGREEFPLKLAVSTPSAGPVTGSVTFELTSRVSGESRLVELPVSGSILVPLPDPVTDVRTLWLLFGIAAGLPLLTYLVLAVWTSRFASPAEVFGKVIADVEVTRTGVVSSAAEPDSERLLGHLEPEKWNLAAQGHGLVFRAPIRLVRLPTAIAECVSGGRGAVGPEGSAGRILLVGRSRQLRCGRLAHQLHRQWVFVPESFDQRLDVIRGRLVVLLRSDIATNPIAGEADLAVTKVLEDAGPTLVADFDTIRQMVERAPASNNEHVTPVGPRRWTPMDN